MTRTEHAWWRGAALYQIYPLSFADSNGDGWGDLPGITARLDHVASLGVDGIWLSPFYESPFTDFGYDTTDQMRVDPRCGTLEDFDVLLARAHDLGLKVVVDQVYSYTSNRHPWFLASQSSHDNPRHDWYVWADARPDGTPPNNWMSIFGGPAWEWSRSRRQYYMTHFLPGMPHLRVEHPQVQQALLQIGRFWLERGVDGFRLDVINLCMVDPQLRDNPRSGQQTFVMPAHAQIPLYDASLPANLDFVRRIRQLSNRYADCFLMGELAGAAPMPDAIEYTRGEQALHSAYFVLGPENAPLTAAALRRDLAAWTQDQPGWPTWSFSNHDIVRGVSRCGGRESSPEFAKLLLAVLATARGTMLLYQGDELGLPDGEVPYAQLRDPASRRFYPDHLQRDGARTPMPWQADAYALGFTTGTPWLPLGARHRDYAVDGQAARDDSTLAFTRELLALRRREPLLRTAAVRFLELPDPTLGFDRCAGSQRIRCVFNVSDQPVSIDWPDHPGEHVLAEQRCSAKPPGRLELGAYGLRIAKQQACRPAMEDVEDG